ncbi:hypothetical protein ACVR2G_004203, partial [Cronobacter sakazakii]
VSEMSEEALAAACEEKVKQIEFSVKQSAFDSVRQELETELAIARVALLALRKEREAAVPVAEIIERKHPADLVASFYRTIKSIRSFKNVSDFPAGTKLYAAPQPVAVPDDAFERALSVLNDTLDDCGDSERALLLALDRMGIEVRSDACRAAMLAAPGKEV